MENVSESTKELMSICCELSDLQKSKNEDYGDACKALYDKYGVDYYLIMLEQKIIRIKNVSANETVNNENVRDSFMDLAGYAIHAIKDLG